MLKITNARNALEAAYKAYTEVTFTEEPTEDPAQVVLKARAQGMPEFTITGSIRDDSFTVREGKGAIGPDIPWGMLPHTLARIFCRGVPAAIGVPKPRLEETLQATIFLPTEGGPPLCDPPVLRFSDGTEAELSAEDGLLGFYFYRGADCWQCGLVHGESSVTLRKGHMFYRIEYRQVTKQEIHECTVSPFTERLVLGKVRLAGPEPACTQDLWRVWGRYEIEIARCAAPAGRSKVPLTLTLKVDGQEVGGARRIVSTDDLYGDHLFWLPEKLVVVRLNRK